MCLWVSGLSLLDYIYPRIYKEKKYFEKTEEIIKNAEIQTQRRQAKKKRTCIFNVALNNNVYTSRPSVLLVEEIRIHIESH